VKAERFPVSGRRIILRAKPNGLPKAEDFACETAAVSEPGTGQILVRVDWLSIDGFMAGRLKDQANYAPGVGIGQTMQAFGVGRVVLSGTEHFTVGDYVYGPFGMCEWALMEASPEVKKLDPSLGPPRLHLGMLGISGWTAYVGLFNVGVVRPGETVLVSAAAGGVGAVAGQLAQIGGARAVGIVGSEEKVALATSKFGYAAAISRHDSDFSNRLSAACPNGIDVYFDNTGGAIYDNILDRMNIHGRIVVCGRMANAALADSRQDIGPRDHNDILVKRLRKQGFIVTDYSSDFDRITRTLAALRAEGRLVLPEDIAEGLPNAPGALVRLLRGENLGKQLVRIGTET